MLIKHLKYVGHHHHQTHSAHNQLTLKISHTNSINVPFTHILIIRLPQKSSFEWVGERDWGWNLPSLIKFCEN